MKSRELRIGNIVTTIMGSENEFTIITGYDLWHTDNLQNVLHPTGFNTLKPIPLTEEWLLKFGFVINDDFVSEDHLWKDWVKKGVRIQLPYFEWADADRELSIEVKFVHQLQNLYFALTGQELEIK